MRNRSRLLRHQSRQAARQAVWYFLLSVVFIVLVVRFGVPAFIQGVSWWSGKADTQKQSTELDVPPQAPVLGDLPVATFSSQIKVFGLSQVGLKVKLAVNDSQVDEMTVKDDGSFSFDKVALKEGDNRIRVTSVSDKNVESRPTEVTISMDKTPPRLEIVSPQDGSQISGVKAQNLAIDGKVDKKETDVTINSNYVSVNSDGSFEYRTRLNQGENNFIIIATDLAGNVSQQTLKVNFSL